MKMHMSKNQIPKIETIERTVKRLRKRFDSLLGKCGGPDRLAKKLSEFDPYFNESKGIYDVANAKVGKAGEEAMIRILAAMELLAGGGEPATPLSRVEKSLARMNIGSAEYQPKYPATQKLKEKMQTSKKS